MASRAYDVVLRADDSGTESRRLPRVRSSVQFPVQLLLREHRRSSASSETRHDHAPRARDDHRVPAPCGPRDGIAHAGRSCARRRRIDRARMQSRTAASGTAADRHSASVRAEPSASGLQGSGPDCGRQDRQRAASYRKFDGGVVEVGHDGEGFAFDCEGPRHRVLLEPYELANRLVTNAEWMAFIADGGYRNPLLWLSAGWATVLSEGWTRAAVLGRARRRLLVDDAARGAACRSRRAGHACELLRS